MGTGSGMGGITQRSHTALGTKATILEDCGTQEQGRANVFTIDPFFGSRDVCLIT